MSTKPTFRTALVMGRLGALSLLSLQMACGFDANGVDDQPGFGADAATADAWSAQDAYAAHDAYVSPDAAQPPDASPPPDAQWPDAKPNECPPNYIWGLLVGGQADHCYRHITTVKKWTSARTYCEGDAPGAYLAIPGSTSEYFGLRGAYFGSLWLGISDRQDEGVFVTVAGGSFDGTGMWGFGQPDNGNGETSEDCVALTSNGLMDLNCDKQQEFICEVGPP